MEIKEEEHRCALISSQELIYMIRKEIELFQQTLTARPVHDTISLDEAMKLLDEYGLPTSRAKIYKLTSAGEIPHRKYGNKLVFSRKELHEWMDGQMKMPR